MSNDTNLPMQPVVITDDGIVRFQKNTIVRFLLDAGHFGMNQISLLPGVTQEERSQFAQLIGYSVSGFGDLSYTDPEMVAQADKIADELLEQNRKTG